MDEEEHKIAVYCTTLDEVLLALENARNGYPPFDIVISKDVVPSNVCLMGSNNITIMSENEVEIVGEYGKG